MRSGRSEVPMKSLIKKEKQQAPVAQCCAPRVDEKVAQCCAKVSKAVAGCHD
jgi:hypothetical protein